MRRSNLSPPALESQLMGSNEAADFLCRRRFCTRPVGTGRRPWPSCAAKVAQLWLAGISAMAKTLGHWAFTLSTTAADGNFWRGGFGVWLQPATRLRTATLKTTLVVGRRLVFIGCLPNGQRSRDEEAKGRPVAGGPLVRHA